MSLVVLLGWHPVLFANGLFDIYVDVLMQLQRLHPAEGYDRLALEASERGKARSLLDLLNEAEAHIYRGADPKFLEHEATIRQQLDAQAQLRTKQLNGLHTPQQINELEQRLRELTTQYELVESEIRQNSPQYAAGPPTVADRSRRGFELYSVQCPAGSNAQRGRHDQL